MELDRLSVLLRPRPGWEAVDLGLRMVRTWWRPVFLPWLTVAVPCAAVLTATLGFAGLLIFWWLLPVWESLAVFALSRAVFGAPPTWRETLRAWPRSLPRIGPELLLRRFHPARAPRLPIRQLEGLRGKDWRGRSRALSVREHSPGLLPPVFMTFELILGTALLSLMTTLLPASLGFDWSLIGERLFVGALPESAYRMLAFFLSVPILILHPLYVGAGFGLYLDARTRLEGWDLEVGFRKLRRRLLEPSKAALGFVVALGLAALLAGPGRVEAQAQPDAMPEAASESGAEPGAETGAEAVERHQDPAPWDGPAARDPRTVIAEVMSRPELQTEETTSRWRLRTSPGSDGTAPLFIGLLLAAIAKPLLWLVAGLVVFLLLRAAWHAARQHTARGARPSTVYPERLAGIELRPDALPDDIVGTARGLWDRGDPSGALSLLYRGALTRLIRDGLALRESFTEDDCLRAAAGSVAGERLSFLGDLTRAWQQVAYAHRAPTASTAESLLRDWPRHFGNVT